MSKQHKSSQVGRCIGRIASCLAVAGLTCVVAPAQATQVNLQNFNSLSDFTLNGATAAINTGGMGVVGPNVGDARVLRLTNNYGQSGSAFLTNSISLASDASFSSYFEFQFTNQGSGGADGIVFTVQTVANTAGGGGGATAAPGGGGAEAVAPGGGGEPAAIPGAGGDACDIAKFNVVCASRPLIAVIAS